MLHTISIGSFRNYSDRKNFNNAVTGFVRVDRKSVLGNPFPMDNESERAEVIEKHRVWLWANINRDDVKNELIRLLDLARKQPITLMCWCAPKACHAENIRRAIQWMDGFESRDALLSGLTQMTTKLS